MNLKNYQVFITASMEIHENTTYVKFSDYSHYQHSPIIVIYAGPLSIENLAMFVHSKNKGAILHPHTLLSRGM